MKNELVMKISQRDFGGAIVSFIGRKRGVLFFPFSIEHASIKCHKEINITLGKEKQFPSLDEKKYVDPIGMFTLTKEEVLEALAFEVVLLIGKRPYREVKKVSVKLPAEIKVTLKYIPRGTLLEDVHHNFDGSI